MKTFPGLIVLCAVALTTHAAGAEYRSEPGICVVMQEKGDTLPLDAIHLRPLDGNAAASGGAGGGSACGGVAGAKGPNGCSWSYDYSTSYEVISERPGHFTVLAHYNINWNGLSLKVDRMLPVWEKKPDQTKWSSLDRHFTAFAYLTANAIR